MDHKVIESDVLIIGGGTAGCYAAIKLAETSDLTIAIAEKADIRRSGCLAAGVNALNAYITEGHEPMDYVRYASLDADGIVREDLLLDICERLNEVTHDMEKRGLTILKDENGKYVSRGWRNLKINGENIKPILAGAVAAHDRISVYNHVNITDYRSSGKRICGAYGFGVNDGLFYEFRSKAVLIATGGAAGIYRPNNPGENSHQMWYCPFNTGAGYAMGILAGAEMTTFEMRFIALRCKDTIAPTGTLAQGVGAKQINGNGEIYEKKYGLTTSQRLWGTVTENLEGRGPCFLKTEGITEKQEDELYKAYLNMAPLQTLKWLEAGVGPSRENVEIEGTEPYIVGGHTASGYWVDRDRSTTLSGLFAAGDVAGGAPQKYVTGALAEGEIAAEGIISYFRQNYGAGNNQYSPCSLSEELSGGSENEDPVRQAERKKKEYEAFLTAKKESDDNIDDISRIRPEQIENAMQKIMDEYAGGIKTNYRYSGNGLKIAETGIKRLQKELSGIRAVDADELTKIYEIRERLIVALVLIAHLRARKETRWRGFQENTDHAGKSSDFECYINSVYENGNIRVFKKELIKIGDKSHGSSD